MLAGYALHGFFPGSRRSADRALTDGAPGSWQAMAHDLLDIREDRQVPPDWLETDGPDRGGCYFAACEYVFVWMRLRLQPCVSLEIPIAAGHQLLHEQIQVPLHECQGR